MDLDLTISQVSLLGVRVHCVGLAGLLGTVEGWLQPDSGPASLRTVAYINAHCLNYAEDDPAYKDFLNGADLVYADGVGAVWAGRYLQGGRLHKLTGADWIDDFCRLAGQNGWRVYLLAGRPGVAHQAAGELLRRYPGLKLVGCADGFFRAATEREVLAEIARLAPDVVFVGMGTPRQEHWLAAHRQDIPARVCWVVGALFDYVAGVEPRAPSWMRRLPLEWLWRMLVNPREKWKRYVFGNPQFVLRILRQKWVQKPKIAP